VRGVSRVLLPDSMLRRRQYGVEVIWAALLAAARRQPWNRIAAGLGVPYTTVREWLRRFARRADRVHAWLCGLLPRLADDPVWPAGTASAAGDVLAVSGALHQQMPGRWPLVAALSPGQLAARLSRCGLLAPSGPPGMIVGRIAYGIDTRQITVITGEVGAGKSVAARAAVARLDASRYQLIAIPNSQVGARGIHHAVVAALGGVPRVHHATLIPQAAGHLEAELAERGRLPVLLIDFSDRPRWCPPRPASLLLAA
jgi:hypothetical protein